MAVRNWANHFGEQMREVYVGIDLALPGRKRTGVSVLNIAESTYFVDTLSSRKELMSFVLDQKPSFVCIDAPLGLPRHGYNRLIEIKARRLGLRLLPPLLGPMRSLTMYGIQVMNELRQANIKVLEVHPTSTLKVLGIDRQGFMGFMTSLLRGPQVSNIHEVDALISAFTCLLHDHGCTESLIGYDGEGVLIIPRNGCEIQVLLHGHT